MCSEPVPSRSTRTGHFPLVSGTVAETTRRSRPRKAWRKTSWPEPGPGDWVTYDGDMSGNRYSQHKQIRTANVAALKLKWVFPIAHFGLEVTPLAADGVLYVTGPNQVYALDAVEIIVLLQRNFGCQ